MDRSVWTAWPTTRNPTTARRLRCRWPRRGRDGTARSRLRSGWTRTVVDARTQKPRREVRGLRLRVGNSRPRQRSSQQGASTPRPRIATPIVRLIRTNPGSTVGVAWSASHGRGGRSTTRCFVSLAPRAWRRRNPRGSWSGHGGFHPDQTLHTSPGINAHPAWGLTVTRMRRCGMALHPDSNHREAVPPLLSTENSEEPEIIAHVSA